MLVIRKDVFLITLIRDVSKWYDKWYVGNLVAMKDFHTKMLLLYYDIDRFRNCNNLCKERSNFLTEVQEVVDTSISSGEANLWMN